MTDLQVIDAAKSLAAKFNIKLDTRGILENMQNRGNQTTIVSRGGVILWIDRYYISFSHNDGFDVHYVYLSRKQIKEELPDIARRLKRVNAMNDFILLSGIQLQMRHALSEMNARSSDDYIFDSFAETCSWEGWDGEYAAGVAY